MAAATWWSAVAGSHSAGSAARCARAGQAGWGQGQRSGGQGTQLLESGLMAEEVCESDLCGCRLRGARTRGLASKATPAAATRRRPSPRPARRSGACTGAGAAGRRLPSSCGRAAAGRFFFFLPLLQINRVFRAVLACSNLKRYLHYLTRYEAHLASRKVRGWLAGYGWP